MCPRPVPRVPLPVPPVHSRAPSKLLNTVKAHVSHVRQGGPCDKANEHPGDRKVADTRSTTSKGRRWSGAGVCWSAPVSWVSGVVSDKRGLSPVVTWGSQRAELTQCVSRDLSPTHTHTTYRQALCVCVEVGHQLHSKPSDDLSVGGADAMRDFTFPCLCAFILFIIM